MDVYRKRGVGERSNTLFSQLSSMRSRRCCMRLLWGRNGNSWGQDCASYFIVHTPSIIFRAKQEWLSFGFFTEPVMLWQLPIREGL